jgi:hypothetical protein
VPSSRSSRSGGSDRGDHSGGSGQDDCGGRGDRTLFVSDLDSTLLRGDGTLSPRTIEVVNRLTDAGGLFTY